MSVLNDWSSSSGLSQDLATCFIRELLNVEIVNTRHPPEPRGPTHHPILRYLFRRLRNDAANNTTRLEHRMRRGSVRWSIPAIPVTRYARDRNDHPPASRITSLHHVISRRIENSVQTMISAFIVWRHPVQR